MTGMSEAMAPGSMTSMSFGFNAGSGATPAFRAPAIHCHRSASVLFGIEDILPGGQDYRFRALAQFLPGCYIELPALAGDAGVEYDEELRGFLHGICRVLRRLDGGILHSAQGAEITEFLVKENGLDIVGDTDERFSLCRGEDHRRLL